MPNIAVIAAEPLVVGIVASWVVAGALLFWRRMVAVGASSVLGAAVSWYLGMQHHVSAGDSFCAVNATFDCDAVNRSQWSEIFGIPIAFLGLGFYVAVLAGAALRMAQPDRCKGTPPLLLVGGILAVAYSIFLAVVSAQLGKWCLLCISMYGYNAIILLGGVLAVRDDGAPLGQGLSRAFRGDDDRSLWTMVGAGIVTLVVGLGIYNRTGDAAAHESSGDISVLYEATVGPLELDGTEPILGDPKAPYTVVEFADFQCPACAGMVPDAIALVETTPEVRLMFKHYPISDICNDQIDGERHDRACPAAFATECARLQGRFWELEKLEFKNQAYLEDEDIRFLAEQVGLDMDAFETCMSDPRTEKAIRADVAAADKVGLTFTPSFYVLGLFGPDEWVLVKGGPLDIKLLVEHHKAGTPLPPPPPPPAPAQ